MDPFLNRRVAGRHECSSRGKDIAGRDSPLDSVCPTEVNSGADPDGTQ